MQSDFDNLQVEIEVTSQEATPRCTMTQLLAPDRNLNEWTSLNPEEYKRFVSQGKALSTFRVSTTHPNDPTHLATEFHVQEPDFISKLRANNPRLTVCCVDDGWLIGTNRGEWGGSVKWYDLVGKNSYLVTRGNPVDCFGSGGERIFVEGIGHLGAKRGSVLRLRNTPDDRWVAERICDLGSNPIACCQNKSATVLIVLSTRVVEFSADTLVLRDVASFADDYIWGIEDDESCECTYIAFPRSSCAMGANEMNLFVGASGGICKVDLLNRDFSFLIPPSRH